MLFIWAALALLGMGFRRLQQQHAKIFQGASLRDIPIGVLLLDAHGYIIGANDRAQELLGCPLHGFDEASEPQPESSPALSTLIDEEIVALDEERRQSLSAILSESNAWDGFARLYGAPPGIRGAGLDLLRATLVPMRNGTSYFLFDGVEDPRYAPHFD